jgi:anaerobic dimethyl sulfoxide reductase subunit C (anchor subunit)
MWLTVVLVGGAFAVMTGAHKVGTVAIIGGVLVSLVTKPDYIGFVTQQAPELAVQQYTLWGLQAVMLVIAAAVCLVTLMRKETMKPLIIGGAAVVLVSELLGRIAFYNLWAIPM